MGSVFGKQSVPTLNKTMIMKSSKLSRFPLGIWLINRYHFFGALNCLYLSLNICFSLTLKSGLLHKEVK